MFQKGINNVNYKHGLRKHKLFSVWSNMLDRCNSATHKAYKDYGARGITVCKEWKEDFMTFFMWAMKEGYRNGLSLDRIDNNKGYNPMNCRWVTMKEQSNNRRSNHLLTFNGKTQTMQQWADEVGINYWTLRDRLARCHWSIEKALTQPIRKRGIGKDKEDKDDEKTEVVQNGKQENKQRRESSTLYCETSVSGM